MTEAKSVYKPETLCMYVKEKILAIKFSYEINELTAHNRQK